MPGSGDVQTPYLSGTSPMYGVVPKKGDIMHMRYDPAGTFSTGTPVYAFADVTAIVGTVGPAASPDKPASALGIAMETRTPAQVEDFIKIMFT